MQVPDPTNLDDSSVTAVRDDEIGAPANVTGDTQMPSSTMVTVSELTSAVCNDVVRGFLFEVGLPNETVSDTSWVELRGYLRCRLNI